LNKTSSKEVALCFHSLEKWANLRLPLNVQKPKNALASGGFALWPSD